MAEHSNVRSLIINEASALFAEKGYAGLSMRELAYHVGVSKAALYYYFSDKEQLFVEIISQFLDEIQTRLEKILDTYPDLRSQLLEVVHHIEGQSNAKKQLIWYLRHDIRQLSDEKVSHLVYQYHHGFVNTLEKMFKDAMVRGEIKSLNPKILAWVFLGMVYPFVNNIQANQSMEQSWTVNIVEVFLDGVNPRD